MTILTSLQEFTSVVTFILTFEILTSQYSFYILHIAFSTLALIKNFQFVST